MNRYEKIWKMMARPCLAFLTTEEGTRFVGIDADGGGLIHTEDICDVILFNDEDDVRLIDHTGGNHAFRSIYGAVHNNAVAEIKRLYGRTLKETGTLKCEWYRKSNAGDNEDNWYKPITILSRTKFVCFYRCNYIWQIAV